MNGVIKPPCIAPVSVARRDISINSQLFGNSFLAASYAASRAAVVRIVASQLAISSQVGSLPYVSPDQYFLIQDKSDVSNCPFSFRGALVIQFASTFVIGLCAINSSSTRFSIRKWAPHFSSIAFCAELRSSKKYIPLSRDMSLENSNALTCSIIVSLPRRVLH